MNSKTKNTSGSILAGTSSIFGKILSFKWKLNRRYLVLPLDMLFAMVSFYVAGILRFDSFFPTEWDAFPGIENYLKILTLLIFTKAAVFVFMGLYRQIWAYASTHDMLLILKTAVLSSLLGTTVLLFYNRLEGISRSVMILDGVLLFLLLSMRSFSWRIFRDMYYLRRSRHGKRTLFIGAGEAANRLVSELRSSPVYHILPVGFLDDNTSKIGANIQGLPIMGSIDDMDGILTHMKIESVIIATKLPGSRIRKLYRSCEDRGISCKTLPPLREILGKPKIGESLRDISLEDLLGRDVVRLETEGIRKTLEGKTILITGAGGSIGSEVCRQLLSYYPAAMILLDCAETPLYEIDYELRDTKVNGQPLPRIVSVIGDVRRPDILKDLFQSYDIHTVFHCAAYKHVPMMELHPEEAVLNNVIGAWNTANAARDAGVDRFVMISTDKAVNPVNIMGATKRIAEIYIQNLAKLTDTKFITVRFGNVLGSNGSVIPLFKKQIAAGGPVTITHPEIIRYFMTIAEAAGLVIQAGVMGKGGEIFLLDMGEPVKIKDLAEDIVRFAGLVPHQDVEFRYIGLRPGEKLFEELLQADEGIEPTRHDKIYVATSRNMNLNTLVSKIKDLEQAALNHSHSEVTSIISSILPEYRSANTIDYQNQTPSPSSLNLPPAGH